MTGKVFRNARRNCARNLRWIKFISTWQQPFTMATAARIAPLAGVIKLADHTWAHIIAPVIEFFLELIFKQLTFFFDDENFFQTGRKRARAFGFEWPAHAHFIQTQANITRNRFVDTQIFQRLTRVEIGFTRGHDAEACIRAVPDHAIEVVRSRIGERCVPFVIDQPLFLLEDAIRPANIKTTGGHVEITWQGNLHALRINIDRGAGFHYIGHTFHRHPQTGVTAHRKTMQAVIEIFLYR